MHNPEDGVRQLHQAEREALLQAIKARFEARWSIFRNVGHAGIESWHLEDEEFSGLVEKIYGRFRTAADFWTLLKLNLQDGDSVSVQEQELLEILYRKMRQLILEKHPDMVIPHVTLFGLPIIENSEDTDSLR